MKLVQLCGWSWALGLGGMGISQALFGSGPEALPFAISGALWIVGGLGYAILGAVVHLDGAGAER